MKVILIDGVEYEVGSEKHLAKLDANHNAALKVAQDALSAAEAKAVLAEKRAVAAEAQVTTDAIDARVDARLTLLRCAAKFLPGTYDSLGKSDAQIRLDAVATKLTGEELAGKDDTFVSACFTILSKDADSDKAEYHNPARADSVVKTPVLKLDDDNDFRKALAERAKGESK